MAKLLLVDDQPLVLQSLRLLFHDYDVLTAESAFEALQQLKLHPDVGVIISDQRMPGMEGIELLRRVKTNYPQIIRILLTGYADIDAIIASVNEGEVFRFVAKPWNAEKLRNIVHLAMGIFQRRNFVATGLMEPKGSLSEEKPKIVVVDEVPKHLFLVKDLLEKEGYDVFGTDDFTEAAALAESSEVGVMVCDVRAKGRCGIEFLIDLKEKFPDIVPIMHSRQADASVAIRLVNEVRVFRYIVKPFKKQYFLDTVKAAAQQYLLWRKKPLMNDLYFERSMYGGGG